MKPLALTMGDPAGIGGELSLRAWLALRERGLTFVLLDDPERVLRILDKYEGIGEKASASEFVRKRNRVKLRSGKEVMAWVYWYNFDPKDKIRIKQKNYLNYLKNKSIH